MDLIYTDINFYDVGVILNYSIDIAFGDDENDFELTVDLNDNVLSTGDIFYLSENDEESSLGGIVDGYKVDTKNHNITYSGRTFEGILSSKIIQPDSGQDYYIANGNINTILNTLITRCGLSELVKVRTMTTKSISNYQFDRYIDLYQGIRKMLKTKNLKLKMAFYDRKLYIWYENIADYSEDEEWDSSQMNFTIKSQDKFTNHLICLGKGELKDREVLHLYRDEDNNISKTQTYTGNEEVCGIYENTSTDELEVDAINKFKEIIKGVNDMSVDFVASSFDYDLDDIVGAREEITGTFVSRYIKKVIIKIKNGVTTISYDIG